MMIAQPRATIWVRPVALMATSFALGMGCGSVPVAPAEPPATVFLLAAPAAAPPARQESNPAVAAPARARSEWNSIARGKSLEAAIKTAAAQAAANGLLPVLFVGQLSCEPCESVKRYRDDPRMQDALTGVCVIEVDLGRYSSSALSDLGMFPHGIPAFYVLDDQGRYTGKVITGGAWGDDIPENMAPPLSEFFARARQ